MKLSWSERIKSWFIGKPSFRVYPETWGRRLEVTWGSRRALWLEDTTKGTVSMWLYEGDAMQHTQSWTTRTDLGLYAAESFRRWVCHTPSEWFAYNAHLIDIGG